MFHRATVVFCRTHHEVERFSARHNLQFRTLYLLLHVQVGNAFHIPYRILYLVTQREHLVQVVAEKFDGDACLRTTQHGIDTVTDGLPDFDVGSGQYRQLTAYVFQHFLV